MKVDVHYAQNEEKFRMKKKICKSILKVISYLITKSSRKLTVKNLFKLRKQSWPWDTNKIFKNTEQERIGSERGVL